MIVFRIVNLIDILKSCFQQVLDIIVKSQHKYMLIKCNIQINCCKRHFCIFYLLLFLITRKWHSKHVFLSQGVSASLPEGWFETQAFPNLPTGEIKEFSRELFLHLWFSVDRDSPVPFVCHTSDCSPHGQWRQVG